MSRQIDHCFHAMVHERWADLPDGHLIACCNSGLAATELAKAMARRCDDRQSYVVTDIDTGEQFIWTKVRVGEVDTAAARRQEGAA